MINIKLHGQFIAALVPALEQHIYPPPPDSGRICSSRAGYLGPQFHSHVILYTNFFLGNIQIWRVRRQLTFEAVKTAVTTLVLSRMDYCNSLLSGLSKKLIKRVQLVQNSAAKMIFGLQRYDHVTPALITLHWLPIQQRIDFKILLITYKALNDMAPQYLQELLELYTTTRDQRSAPDPTRLVSRQPRLKGYGARAFEIYAPAVWNSLPQHLRESPSLDIFRKRLKTHLFVLAFS